MNKIIEIAAMALGGISLLTVCFLGFALMSGTPLHDIAVVGSLFPTPEEAQSTSSPAEGEESEPPAHMGMTDEQIVSNQADLVHAWQLPSPFTAEELSDLAEGLKMRHHALDVREGELDQRETELADQEVAVQDRIEGLVRIQEQMDRQRQQIEDLQKGLDSRVKAEDRREENKWASQARLFSSMEAEKRNDILSTGNYEPEEMARILKAMSDDIRGEVMNGLQEKVKDPALLRAYIDAYSEIAAEGAQ